MPMIMLVALICVTCVTLFTQIRLSDIEPPESVPIPSIPTKLANTVSSTILSAACDLRSGSIKMRMKGFVPSIKIRPPQSRAVITIFAPMTSNTTYDTNFADALLLAYQFKSLPRKNKPGVEFVVAHVGPLSKLAKTSFLDLGARLLQVPDILEEKKLESNEDGFKPCGRSCFAKIYLFGLEGVFSDILYVDSASVLSDSISFDDVFSLSTGNGYFGAVPSFGLGQNVLDSSVLLFKPSISRMNSMYKVLSQSDVGRYYQDQAFLNDYFFGPLSPSCTTWSRLPELFNFQLLSYRNSDSMKSASIIPHSFWSVKPSSNSPAAKIHADWSDSMQMLFTFQMDKYKRSDVGLIPTSISDLDLMIRGNTFNHKLLIITVMSDDSEKKVFDRTMRNRKRYCERHPEVVHHLQSIITAKNAVWQKVWTLEELIGNVENHFNWVWLLDGRDALIMNGEIELRALLAKLALERPDLDMDILIARDISLAMNAGSFFVRNSEWTRQVFIPEWKMYADHPEHNDHSWQEQWALMRMYDDEKNDTTKHLYQLDQRRQNLFNAFTFGPEPTYKPGDFVVHAPSMGWEGLYSFLEENDYKEY
ncbi:hypothetical protein BCR33DRAFT_717563 [Rhizoclosmatium globosum]|uniref:Nucleotide-diphospho-sugar transferase domain-containing protein n=1 Tax=Rhizoclosmatium globosum TaxID=329046 RepID=A0A1Y2C8S1_9FUNG|nr:hypothetical protein BCR33DRAFT_717563 [Rhizoclosmatium globosum]|eukprot:ORY43336.1 hypothetical protein BCR33DRAFT_717563 [Rhizoclosmatium globosum]